MSSSAREIVEIEQDLLKKLSFGLFFRRNPIWPFRTFIRNLSFFLSFSGVGDPGQGNCILFP
jgi:hypothetical protein